jgi:DNA invertase Pin-like site-specific DNA recombinase
MARMIYFMWIERVYLSGLRNTRKIIGSLGLTAYDPCPTIDPLIQMIQWTASMKPARPQHTKASQPVSPNKGSDTGKAAIRKLYYGRVSTLDGQTSASQYEDAAQHGVDPKDVFIDEGVSGYHVAPLDRPQWPKVEQDLRHGGLLLVRWLDRISRNYDELHETMQRLMKARVRVDCTMNGMSFDGAATDATAKAVRDAVLAFMAAQGEADYRNRREMQARGIAVAKKQGKYRGRVRSHDYAAIRAWREENGASIKDTAEKFGIGTATVKRAMAEGKASRGQPP